MDMGVGASRPKLRILATDIDARCQPYEAHQDATRSTLSANAQLLRKSKGSRNTKLHAVVNQAGRAVALRLLPGQKHESQDALAVLPEGLRLTLVLVR